MRSKSVVIWFLSSALAVNTGNPLSRVCDTVAYQPCLLAPQLVISHSSFQNVLFAEHVVIERWQEKVLSTGPCSSRRQWPRQALAGRELTLFYDVVRGIAADYSEFPALPALAGFLRTPPVLIPLSADGYAYELQGELEQAQKKVKSRRAQVKPMPDSVWGKLEELDLRFYQARAFLSPFGIPVERIYFAPEANVTWDLRDKIIEKLSWLDTAAVGYRGGRKIYFNAPVTAGETVYDTLEAKGAVYRDPNAAVTPPSYDRYRPHNPLAAFWINRRNMFETSFPVLLKGGLSEQKAEHEFNINRRLQGQSFALNDYAIAWGSYLGYRYRNKRFGFLVTASAGMPLRLWWLIKNLEQEKIEAMRRGLNEGDPADIAGYLNEWIYIRDKENDELRALVEEQELYERYVKRAFVAAVDQADTILLPYAELFYACGEILRNFHDRGFAHSYPHLDNYSQDARDGRVYLHDFESAKRIAHLSWQGRVGYRLLDLKQAYIHFITFVFGLRSGKDFNVMMSVLAEKNNAFNAFFYGYFGEELSMSGIDAKDVGRDAVKHFNEGRTRPIDVLDSPLMRLLREIEQGPAVLKKCTWAFGHYQGCEQSI